MIRSTITIIEKADDKDGPIHTVEFRLGSEGLRYAEIRGLIENEKDHDARLWQLLTINTETGQELNVGTGDRDRLTAWAIRMGRAASAALASRAA